MEAAAEYARRRARQEAALAAARRRDRWLGTGKVAAAFSLLAVAWLAVVSHRFSALWLLAPVGALAGLSVAHERALEAGRRAANAARFYGRGQARLEDRWAGSGPGGERFSDPNHPFAADLDLFGRGSLFELMCEARTPMGEAKLASWMCQWPEVETIRQRQGRVAGLTPRLDLREELAVVGGDLKTKLNPDGLTAWATAAPGLAAPVGAWPALGGLVLAFVASGVYGAVTGKLAPLLLVLAVEAVVTLRMRSGARALLSSLGCDGEGLRLFAAVAGRAHAHAAAPAAEAPLRRLAQLADWAEAAGSFVVSLVDIPLLYNAQLALAAEGWRRRHGAQVAGWIDGVAEYEALLSLAGYALEHPADPYAKFEESGAPAFEGEGLAHPLLPAATCVPNTVRLGAEARILLVSGSNMSGKSTLLRTVGINAVLAHLGVPVRATGLRLTPLRLGTCLRTHDSLRDGRSGFYAEVLRLRTVLDLSRGPLPLLFLFDELLEGTNSHDRVAGGEGLLRALLARRAIGLVTTHDLALAAAEEGLAPAVENVHFEDQVEAGQLRFDHRLRPGVVTKSNALALMRLAGLEV